MGAVVHTLYFHSSIVQLNKKCCKISDFLLETTSQTLEDNLLLTRLLNYAMILLQAPFPVIVVFHGVSAKHCLVLKTLTLKCCSLRLTNALTLSE